MSLEVLYKKLGLSSNASQSDIKKAYRQLAMTHHPDKGGNPEKFKEIVGAHEILSNPEKQAEYLRNDSSAASSNNESTSVEIDTPQGKVSVDPRAIDLLQMAKQDLNFGMMLFKNERLLEQLNAQKRCELFLIVSPMFKEEDIESLFDKMLRTSKGEESHLVSACAVHSQAVFALFSKYPNVIKKFCSQSLLRLAEANPSIAPLVIQHGANTLSPVGFIDLRDKQDKGKATLFQNLYVAHLTDEKKCEYYSTHRKFVTLLSDLYTNENSSFNEDEAKKLCGMLGTEVLVRMEKCESAKGNSAGARPVQEHLIIQTQVSLRRVFFETQDVQGIKQILDSEENWETKATVITNLISYITKKSWLLLSSKKVPQHFDKWPEWRDIIQQYLSTLKRESDFNVMFMYMLNGVFRARSMVIPPELANFLLGCRYNKDSLPVFITLLKRDFATTIFFFGTKVMMDRNTKKSFFSFILSSAQTISVFANVTVTEWVKILIGEHSHYLKYDIEECIKQQKLPKELENIKRALAIIKTSNTELYDNIYMRVNNTVYKNIKDECGFLDDLFFPLAIERCVDHSFAFQLLQDSLGVIIKQDKGEIRHEDKIKELIRRVLTFSNTQELATIVPLLVHSRIGSLTLSCLLGPFASDDWAQSVKMISEYPQAFKHYLTGAFFLEKKTSWVDRQGGTSLIDQYLTIPCVAEKINAYSTLINEVSAGTFRSSTDAEKFNTLWELLIIAGVDLETIELLSLPGNVSANYLGIIAKRLLESEKSRLSSEVIKKMEEIASSLSLWHHRLLALKQDFFLKLFAILCRVRNPLVQIFQVTN